MSYIQEEWKPINGYEGIYEVSNAGRVKRIQATPHTKPGLRSPFWVNGYRSIYLWKCGRRRRFSVHGLVATAFLGPRPLDAEVNHIDCLKWSNHVINLEYATRQENARHALANGRYDCDRIDRKLSDADLLVIRELLQHMTPTQVARIYNVTRGLISNIKHGRHRKLQAMTS
jgi:hypothetical protein